MPFLEHDGVTRELPGGETLVGSGSQADWRLLTINLAPRHFTVHVNDAGVAVLTPHRAQEVEVNGVDVSGPHTLAQGDEIIAGAGIFTYLARLETEAPAAPPPSAAQAYLLDIRAGTAYPLGREPLEIGRDPVNHVVIRDPAVSRFHAEIVPLEVGSGFTFRSMGAGGSAVNGTLVGASPRTLVEGDLIRIGDTTLRFTTTPPPPAVRIASRTDAPAGPPGRAGDQHTAGAENSAGEQRRPGDPHSARERQGAPSRRGSEPATLGRGFRSSDTGSGTRIAFIAAVLITVAVALVALMLRAAPH